MLFKTFVIAENKSVFIIYVNIARLYIYYVR